MCGSLHFRNSNQAYTSTFAFILAYWFYFCRNPRFFFYTNLCVYTILFAANAIRVLIAPHSDPLFAGIMRNNPTGTSI